MPRTIVEDNSRLALRVRAQDKATLMRAVALEHTDMTDFVLRHARCGHTWGQVLPFA